MKKEIYIANISGGKDSVTMCDLLLKNNYPVDEIIFLDTLKEFKEMYVYLEKVNNYFKARYKKEITILKPKSTFESWCFGTINKKGAKLVGYTRGIPSSIANAPCYWRREAKIYTFERYVKEKYPKKTIVNYIGYTLKENRSVQDTDTFKYLYPLKTYFRMTEEDCKQYLINNEMENPLYRHFSRTGCFLCPFQSDRAFYEIWKNYPDEWEQIKQIESKLKDEKYCINKYFFMNFKTCEDMEKLFKQHTESLFDFSDEPLKDCFCKI